MRVQRNWSPVKLEGEAIPSRVSPYSDSDVASADLMGSIEVYRYSPDNPVALDCDRYPIITFASSDSMLLLRGPISDSDHRLDEIPERLRGAEVLGVPPSHTDVPEGA